MAGQGIGRGAMVGGIAVLAGVFGVVVWLLTGQSEEAVSAEAEVEQPAAQPSAAQAESAAPSAPPSETPSGVGEGETQEPQEAASEKATPEQPAIAAEAAPEGDTAEVAAPVAPVAPMIDIARLSPNGNAVIAGQGAPGAIIRVMVDGKAAYETEADSSGAFVALFDLTPRDAPRELWLETVVDGQSAAAGQVLMILPGEALAMDADDGDGDGAAAETDTSASAEGETQAEADPAPRLMLADESGVKLLDGAESAAALSLDSISYDAAGAVTIAGRGNGELRLYLNDTLIGSALAKAGQWALELPESVTPGVYDLRVDAIGADGNVVERIESPFMRESQELLAEAAAAAAGPAQQDATPEAKSAAPEGDSLVGSVLEAAGAVADAVEEAVSEAGGEVAAAAEAEVTKQPQEMARDTASDTARDTASDTAQAPAAETRDVAEVATTEPETEAVTAETAPTEPQEVEVAEQAADAGAGGTGTVAATPDATPEPDAPRAAETTAVQDPAPAVRARVVTVQPGNTLWAISRERYGEGVLYVRVFEANRAQIRDPDLIYPGQVFTLPE